MMTLPQLYLYAREPMAMTRGVVRGRRFGSLDNTQWCLTIGIIGETWLDNLALSYSLARLVKRATRHVGGAFSSVDGHSLQGR